MVERFSAGAVVYAKDGRRYVVDDLADGVVYCSSDSGAEVEFSEGQLVSEAEWSSQFDDRREKLYAKLKQSKPFTLATGRYDRTAAEAMVKKIGNLLPGILDFAAVTASNKILDQAGGREIGVELSTAKCRDIFDAATPEVRLSLLAQVLNVEPDKLLSAARLGDNLLRALIDKGMEASAAAFEAFGDMKRS